LIGTLIGKGNFAKVHMCKRKTDDKTFALKSVEKALIRKARKSVRYNIKSMFKLEFNSLRNRHIEMYKLRTYYQTV